MHANSNVNRNKYNNKKHVPLLLSVVDITVECVIMKLHDYEYALMHARAHAHTPLIVRLV